MVGFIIIILMVMIIGVIFLGISLRKSVQGSGVEATDAEISNFMSASLGYVTDCAKDYEPNYRTIEDVIDDCYAKRSCADGRKTCDVLNKTYSEILPNFKPAGSQISAYRMNFYYLQNASADVGESERLDMGFYSGNMDTCQSRKAGMTSISIGEGYIAEVLEVCLKEA